MMNHMKAEGPINKGEVRLWWMEIFLCTLLLCEGEIDEVRTREEFPPKKEWKRGEWIELI